MIQRIQSVYLLVSVALAGIFTFINEHQLLLLKTVGLENVSPSILSLLVMVFAFTTIFLFKNRPLQTKLLWFTIILLLIALGLYAFVDGFSMFFLDWEFYLLPVVFVFLWLAKVGIRRDENLVRSSDRLR